MLAGAVVSQSVSQTSTSYTYDALGRLVRVDRPSSAVTYTYDPADNRANVTSVNPYATSWEAEALWHATGFADADGWAANTSSAAGTMLYGPFVAIPVGPHVAAFRMMIDAPSHATDTIVWIDVYDATTSEYLGSQAIARNRFFGAYQYQTFEIPFEITAGRAGHLINFDVYHTGAAYVRIDKVGYR